MAPATLNTSTVVVQQKVRKRVKGRKVWRWVSVSSPGVSCNDPCTTVTLDPYPTDSSLLLAANRQHRVIITTGVKDKARNALARNYTWYFTTGAS
jgi:hypothetical protein